MERGKTVSVNLYDSHIRILEKLAQRLGSKSAAMQRLLEEAARREVYLAMESAYEHYHAVVGTAEADRKLTAELLAFASWPEQKKEKRRGRKGSRSKR